MSKSGPTGKIVIGILLLLALGVFVTKTFFVNFYRIPQNGMYPTIEANGLIFARLKPYKNVSEVKRGDIVVFQQEEDGEKLIFVWRVVGLPGDEVRTLGDTVQINREPLKHERVRQEGELTVCREHNGDAIYEVAFDYEAKSDQPPANVTVAADQLFVLGDNRFSAHDSRYTGPIPFSSVVARKM